MLLPPENLSDYVKEHLLDNNIVSAVKNYKHQRNNWPPGSAGGHLPLFHRISICDLAL
jgi:hypothetical protein